jgi:CRISPR-associated endoribonuclease Cas6
MKYFELICTAYIKKDISFKDSFEVINKYINFSMAQNQILKTLHERKGYKFYNFGNFYPTEKEKVYKKGNSYQFRLRSPDEAFVGNLSKTLRQNIDNPNFLTVEVTKRAVKQFFVSELYSATPVVVTADKGVFWTMERDGDILKLQRLLHDNLEKKYFDFYGEKLKVEQNFVQLLEIKNRVPQSIWASKNGKNFKFFGNKFRIVPNEDEASQRLAFLALGCGLGEKNSFGGGFCISRGLG